MSWGYYVSPTASPFYYYESDQAQNVGDLSVPQQPGWYCIWDYINSDWDYVIADCRTQANADLNRKVSSNLTTYLDALGFTEAERFNFATLKQEIDSYFRPDNYGTAGSPSATTGTGNGTKTAQSGGPDTITETWTFTCTAAAANSGTFSVVGSTSGAKASATVGVAYHNGFVGVTINDGSTDWIIGDSFTIATTVGSVISTPFLTAYAAEAGTTRYASANALQPILDTISVALGTIQARKIAMRAAIAAETDGATCIAIPDTWVDVS